MNKNQYDTDVITWSPQGRLFQVEYAMEAVKQGSAAVGVTSKKYAVLASLRRLEFACTCFSPVLLAPSPQLWFAKGFNVLFFLGFFVE
jgi:hypothetical protein